MEGFRQGWGPAVEAVCGEGGGWSTSMVFCITESVIRPLMYERGDAKQIPHKPLQRLLVEHSKQFLFVFHDQIVISGYDILKSFPFSLSKRDGTIPL